MFASFRRRDSLALVSILVLLSACAKFETGETKLQRIKTVGVVSAVGDEFSFTRAGLNGTDTGDRRFPIGQWGLDDLIVSQANASIGEHFQVQPLSYSRPAFYA